MAPNFPRKNVGSCAICLVPLLFFAIQCTGQNSNGLWTTKDSWHHPPKSYSFITKARENALPFREVAGAKELQAEKMLEFYSAVPLTFTQAQILTNGSYRRTKNRKTKKSPYLVRAVYLNRETGGFIVSTIRDNLFVHHASLGRYGVPMKRQALIVDLSKPPKNVYITCSMTA